MAKKKDRKNPKSKPGARLEENYSGTDDDGSVYDGASVTSETSTIHGGDLEDGNNGVDESSKVEMFESKLKEALELATAVSGWSLLLSLLSPGDAHRLANSNITKFSGLLRSSDVDLRITGGEAIALILEFAYQYDEEFLPDGLDSLIESLKQLATDSTKSRSKKDRKEQRSSFRDILRTVEDAEPPNEKVKFGQEVLYLDSWDRKLQYEWFAKVLGSGMNLHLTSNFVLREVFELGAPLPAYDPLSSNKMSKSERNAANQLAFKLRTQSRSKNRDKRSSVL